MEPAQCGVTKMNRTSTDTTRRISFEPTTAFSFDILVAEESAVYPQAGDG